MDPSPVGNTDESEEFYALPVLYFVSTAGFSPGFSPPQ